MGETNGRILKMAAMFKALGDPGRLRIFEFLLATSCCPMAVSDAGEARPVIGATVGEVCCQITGEDRVSSTISQQLKHLRHAGLITMERRGKNMICRVDEEAASLMSAYVEECKAGKADTTCCLE